jgi:hypothetical protein
LLFAFALLSSLWARLMSPSFQVHVLCINHYRQETSNSRTFSATNNYVLTSSLRICSVRFRIKTDMDILAVPSISAQTVNRERAACLDDNQSLPMATKQPTGLRSTSKPKNKKCETIEQHEGKRQDLFVAYFVKCFMAEQVGHFHFLVVYVTA